MNDPEIWRDGDRRLNIDTKEGCIVAWRGRELRLFWWTFPMGLFFSGTVFGMRRAIRKALAWTRETTIPTAVAEARRVAQEEAGR